MNRRILLTYDGSQAGQKALLDCQEVAQMQGAELFLIAVMPQDSIYVGGEGAFYDPQLGEIERKKYEGILAEGLRRLSELGLNAKGELVVGHPVEAIVDYAKRVNVDLIVAGHKHLDSWAKRWWSGSVSKSLIEHSHCSVLVVITR
ncbi:universal stress protein [Usitatibacter palustris]|uniref:Stress response protein NhaX n=1 Tax=Usitatibacter palustris TaxID=2732487 RepID=A0A6M4HBH2_9PROT|nr:universal stress protein [Usitatibacter palustris]QJR16946.1 Stress response protein NhaX [Usitatibacter palustris]